MPGDEKLRLKLTVGTRADRVVFGEKSTWKGVCYYKPASLRVTWRARLCYYPLGRKHRSLARFIKGDTEFGIVAEWEVHRYEDVDGERRYILCSKVTDSMGLPDLPDLPTKSDDNNDNRECLLMEKEIFIDLAKIEAKFNMIKEWDCRLCSAYSAGDVGGRVPGSLSLSESQQHAVVPMLMF